MQEWLAEFAKRAAAAERDEPGTLAYAALVNDNKPDNVKPDKNDFLKLDYTAQGVNDDYHVAGYIYEVNDDGSAKSGPIMA